MNRLIGATCLAVTLFGAGGNSAISAHDTIDHGTCIGYVASTVNQEKLSGSGGGGHFVAEVARSYLGTGTNLGQDVASQDWCNPSS